MDPIYIYPLGLLFVYSVYIFGKFFLALMVKVYDKEVFLGFGSISVLKMNFKHLIVHIGLFIPLPFFAQYHRFDKGIKQPITYEWEMDHRSWYDRMIATFGGSISALLMSMLIFSTIAYQEEDTYLSREELNKHGIFPSEMAADQGLKKGDKILQINGREYERFSELLSPDLLSQPEFQLLISRDGETQQLTMSWLDAYQNPDPHEFFVAPNVPHEITAVLPELPAYKAGIKPGDIIKSINGEEVDSQAEIQSILMDHPREEVQIQVQRDDQILDLEVVVEDYGKIGFYSKALLNYTSVRRTLLESIQIGISTPFSFIQVNIKAFSKIFTGNISSSKNLDGRPIGVASLFDNGLLSFFRVCGLLLLIMVFWDLLPLPRSAALKSIPILIEVLFNKKVPLHVFNTIHKGGWALMMLFALATIVSDILSFF